MFSKTALSRPNDNQKISGFSLVEILIYMVIFSLISVGITTLIIQMQRSNILVQNLSNDLGYEDLALRSIQLKLGRADDILIDNVSSGDRACLRLKRNKYEVRTGLSFNGDNQYIKSTSTMPILGAAPRSVSLWFWFDPEKRGSSTLVKWGGSGSSRAKFEIAIDDGIVKIDLGCVSHNFTAETLQARQWYHLGVTYNGGDITINPDSLKLYIDSTPAVMNSVFSTPCGGFNSKLNTAPSFLYVGNNSDNRDTMLTGHISNLKIWDNVLSPQNIADIFNKNNDYDAILPANLKLHWRFNDGVGAQIQNQAFVTIDGMKMNFPMPSSPFHQTARKKPEYEGFCFFDSNADGLYSVWHGEDIQAIPAISGAPGWEKISKEIFIPSSKGFFAFVGSNANSVTVNFAVGTNTDRSVITTQKAKSVTLSTNTSIQLTNICKIDRPVALNASGCTFTSAYVTLGEGYDKRTDRLDYKERIGAAGWTSDRSFTITKLDIPSLRTTLAADNITGMWHHESGVLSFKSTGVSLDVTSWRKILNEISLKLRGTEFTTTKTIRYSLGGLAYVENNIAHFHEFVPAGNGVTSFPFASAVAASTLPTDKFCGLQPYISTITSAAENDVFVKLHEINPAPLQGGWIGASYNKAGLQNWRWMNGPDNDTLFWNSYGTFGRPIYADTGLKETDPTKYFTYGYDHLMAQPTNEYKREIKPKAANKNFRYVNFSFGNNIHGCVDGSCEPFPSPPAPQNLTFQDPASGDYMWHASNQGDAICTTPMTTKVCGYYREFGGMPGDPPSLALYDDVSVDVRKHNVLCGVDP